LIPAADGFQDGGHIDGTVHAVPQREGDSGTGLEVTNVSLSAITPSRPARVQDFPRQPALGVSLPVVRKKADRSASPIQGVGAFRRQ
jgi:hypothetical protein